MSAIEYPLLDIRNLQVEYRTGTEVVHAVRNVSAQVWEGKVTALVGESGSGKSTTAHAVAGLLPANAGVVGGDILYDGRALTELSPEQWYTIRGAGIGLVPQDPGNSLNPLTTIERSLSEAFRIHHRDYHRNDLIELLERVGIDKPEKRLKQYPHELSGGMKQRVLIAAAMSVKPKLLIADEPTSALDVTVQATVLDLLDELRTEYGLGVLLITHDLAVAGDRADTVVVMNSGEVKEAGPAHEVLTRPENAYTQRLLANIPSLSQVTRTPVEDAPPLLHVENLTKKFGAFTAVDNVSFTVARGQTHALVGESGSGKTTTGRIISGFETATQGAVRLGDQEIHVPEGKKRFKNRDIRRRVQLVYQNPLSSLDPRWTIGQTLAEPLKNLTGVTGSEAQDKVEHYLHLVALNGDYARRHPRELSGGQRQRVAIARALITEPELVVLDEPVSALDVTVQAQIVELFDELQQQLGLTYVFITHDLAVARQISDTVSVLQHGVQVEHGTIAEVYEKPQAEFTQKLLAAIPGRTFAQVAH